MFDEAARHTKLMKAKSLKAVGKIEEDHIISTLEQYNDTPIKA
ncbi:hypothetical protein SLEP1_g50695 [Rubroshorea leprosula]|uniref:Uncharacterized protein n=1 Tax=Rubroshorea leprosula TaxID=152421 RepID=A0AAV5M2Y8_9ROSI|nr:hypothetical protein SLEP1_g50695 [Rubroshorea leprosula]